uniref:Uncharacterized protein n=1 Tax=Musa acuminata subsp. malaccensis TaxID=214687 RepID=A0A804IP64_MUSAM
MLKGKRLRDEKGDASQTPLMFVLI